MGMLNLLQILFDISSPVLKGSDNLTDRWKGLMALWLSLVLLYLQPKRCFATLWDELSEKSDEQTTVDLYAYVHC